MEVDEMERLCKTFILITRKKVLNSKYELHV